MALHWNLSKIHNHDTYCWQRRTQAQLDAEGNGETLESLVKRMTWHGSDWSFPDRGESPVEKLAASGEEPYVQRVNPVTHVIILATMNIGMGEITADNTVEFYLRISCVEKVYGAFLNDNGNPRYITFEEVTGHVGLKVNVAPTSWREFSCQTMAGLRRDTLRRIVVPEEQQPSGFGIAAHVLARDARDVLEELEKSMGTLLGEMQEESPAYAIIESGETKIRRWGTTLRNIEHALEEAEGDLVQMYEREELEQEQEK